MNIPLKEQYIIDGDGNKTAIVLPIEQYEQMLEDLHDLTIIAERRAETSVSLAQLRWVGWQVYQRISRAHQVMAQIEQHTSIQQHPITKDWLNGLTIIGFIDRCQTFAGGLMC
jgi:hypothetical protein